MTRAKAAAILAASVLSAAAPARAAPGVAASDALDAVRQQCIAAAQREQQQDATVAALQHQFDLLADDEAGRQRDLDDSRPQQAHLLGVLLFLSRNLDDPLVAAAEAPIDRQRGELLIKATAAELRAEAQALMAEIGETSRLRGEIAARRRTLGAAHAALAQDRDGLAQLVARRQALLRPLTANIAAEPAGVARLAAAANDTGELIRLADAAAERRTRGAATRSGGDATRPAMLRAFDPPQSALQLPVAGMITRRFGEPDADGALSRGLDIAALPGAEVVAPFDGRVVYAGAYRDLGLLLIIRHGALYDSLLAGFGRVDVTVDQWVLVGEPVGTIPDAPAAQPGRIAREGERASSGLLYYELRRSGQPVDPQPWLAAGASGREKSGEQRVGR
jgi:murein hydrolase activator